MMICNDVNFTVAGSTPLSKATAFATADIPQSFPPICFWHLFTVTSMSLSGPDASKLYTCAICLRNGVVSVVFAESYTVTLPPNEHDMTQ